MTTTPLVFLHGLGTGPQAWEPQLAHFAATRIVVAPRMHDEDAATRAIDELIAQHGAADLCGLSLGGLAALQYAATHTGVRRLVVSAAFAYLPEAVRRKVERTARLVSVLPSPVVRRGLAAEVREPWHAAAVESLRALSSRELARTMRSVARLDLRQDLAAVTCPTLVLCGASDQHNIPLSRALADELPNARLALVEGAGHIANLDAPRAFTAAVDEFLG
jgi:pimeloyl-ACP methyl ester carboxylesterase